MPYSSVSSSASAASDSLSECNSDLFGDGVFNESDLAFEFEESQESNPPPSPLSLPLSSKKLKRSSIIWEDTPYPVNYLNIRHHISIWECNPCILEKVAHPKTYRESSGTGCVFKHLKEAHAITLDNNLQAKNKKRNQDIRLAMLQSEKDTYKRRRRDDAFDVKTLEYLYIKWITACGIAFRMVAVPQFRAYVYYKLVLFVTFMDLQYE
jgi:hypothetical protein